MATIGIIIKNGLNLSKQIGPLKKVDAFKNQQKTLLKLLRRASLTSFGKEYHFNKILNSREGEIIKIFQETVPIQNYESMSKWWKQSLAGEPSVCWPGKVEYFALSSGTSSGSSKYIPVTKAMIKAIQRGSVKQILSLANCELPQSFFEKDILMLGGSTSLDYNGIHFAGDLSGITTGNLPFWFQPYYKPGKEISKTKDWQQKLDLITEEADKWDIGAIVGVPSWALILIEKIIERYKLKNIHDLWPNLNIFMHGGVAFEPYKKSFEKVLGKPIIYLETYLASEGFVAYQNHPNSTGMKLFSKNGIFFEFVPFIPSSLDSEGNILSTAKALTINEVEEGVEYALIMSTCSGAWRYAIGDVVKFTDVEKNEIKIIGRTKFFLSLVGEHLSVDNMNNAVELVADDLNIRIKEFTVSGIPDGSLFAHHWFISVEEEVDKEILRQKLDYYLKELNDDYKVERMHALKNIIVDIVPNSVFINWLKHRGREGAQVKFPRVLNSAQYRDWLLFIKQNKN